MLIHEGEIRYWLQNSFGLVYIYLYIFKRLSYSFSLVVAMLNLYGKSCAVKRSNIIPIEKEL